MRLGLGSLHAVSFLLGAALPTALLFFLASDRLGEGVSSISTSWSWRGKGIMLQVGAAKPEANTLIAGDHAAAASPTQNHHEVEFADLAELLPKVAMEDRTVIVTSVNEVWTEPNSLFDIFRDSFKNGEDIEHLLNHVLVVAVGAKGFDRCKAVHPHCYLFEVKSMDMNMAKYFGTNEYVELVWLKLSFQQRVLELGYNVLFTDADILWFRNPFRHISVYADMSCALDNSKATSVLLNNTFNTGLYYMKSTNRSIKMVKYWRAARARFPGDHDQVVFNNIKYELIGELGARIQPLETEYISGFCDFYEDGLDKVCTIHANCCMGLEKKVHDLKNIAADWKNYTSLTPEERKKGAVKLTAPSECRKSMGWH
ncbi:uncharacterized protein At4g15970-like [Phragmites australis]|uniref:uncharacterized protein At4g15970-like n=1 Tax=Phragmites australis TaxID=29695 RepID=UPI002D793ABC|nr:uncharacterized protein At4g15970-like [Phragmites australis]